MTDIVIAYDVPSLDQAIALDERLGTGPEYAKIGLELFTAAGPEVVRELKARGRRVFLDLKLHDIPNTVRGAAAVAARLGADLLTVHVMGGAPMIAAAVDGIRREGGATRVVTVTLLTSLDAYNLPPGFEHPFHPSLVIARQLRMALAVGAYGIVCSANDLPAVTALHPRPFFAVTPGIRPADTSRDDQARVSTVTEAVRKGSSLLVLGRAVTAAPDARMALERARGERDMAQAAAPAC